MDVFVGGWGERTGTAVAGVARALAEIEAPHERADLGSTLVTVWRDERSSQGAHHVDDEVEVLFDGYLHGHRSADLAAHLPVLGRRLAREGRVLDGDESGIFTLVVHDRRDGRLLLAGDPSGLLPLHLALGPDGPTFASHGHLLGQALDAEPDLLGVAWSVYQKWAPGRRTTYEGIERLCAGELVVIHQDGRVERSYPEVYFAEQVEPDGDAADALWEALVAATRPLTTSPGPIGTMLSEGFDSRLVVGLLREVGVDQEVFTHGTADTAGLEITRQLARAIGAPHQVELFEHGFPSDHRQLRRQLLLADNLSVAYWGPTAERVRASGVAAATTGYALDSTVGGHAFVTSGDSRRQAAAERYRIIAEQRLGRLTDADLEATAGRILGTLRDIDTAPLAGRLRRFLVPELAEAVIARLDEMVDDVEQELARVRASGADLDSLLLQRWFLENRGRRFAFGQELTVRSRVPLVVPSYEPIVMRLASSIPPRLRIHHDAYLRLFRRRLPDLAGIRSGAHGMPASWPRAVLETGRFASVVREDRLVRRYLESGGATDPSAGLRAVLFGELTARRADRLPMEGLDAHGITCVDQDWLDLQAKKIRDHQIRVYLPTLYLPTELAQIFDRR